MSEHEPVENGSERGAGQEQTPPPLQTPPAPAELAPAEQRTAGMLCHLAALAGYIIPFGNIIGPLIVWLTQREKMPFVDDQGKESLNFQITVTLAALVSIPLMCIGIGLVLLPLIAVASLVFIIIASVKASAGEWYRYPVTLRLIK